MLTHFKKHPFWFFVLLLIPIAQFESCQPDDAKKPTPKYGLLKIEVINHVGGKDLELDKLIYKNEAGNLYGITRLQYYLANFQFLGATCGDFIPDGDYHLISHINDPNLGNPLYKHTSFTFEIPVGCYDEMNFGIGVDPKRNAEGPYIGDLDFSWNMNWSWSGDYVFFKNEGIFLDQDNKEQKYIFHIGAADYYKTVNLKFAKQMDILEDETQTIYLYANLNEFFKNPNTIDLNKQNATMSKGSLADSISLNYSNMFSLVKE